MSGLRKDAMSINKLWHSKVKKWLKKFTRKQRRNKQKNNDRKGFDELVSDKS